MHVNTLHLGHLHLPIFSLFLAVGLILALLLTQRTAPLAGLSTEAMWDASLFTALSAFLISRTLLIATNFRSFLSYPFLVLTLPALTVTGLLLTAIALAIYLHRRHLPFARVMDAAASSLALLWAILSIGSFLTGSDGLPTKLPWAIQDPLAGPIHPVELYAASAALALAVFLYRTLPHSPKPGTTAATGLFLAGATLFFLDFLTQPATADRIVLLDPVQWVALAMLLTGFFTLLPSLTQPLQST